MSVARAARRSSVDVALQTFFALWFAVLWAVLTVWATRGTLAWMSACDLPSDEAFGRIVGERRYPRADEDCSTDPQEADP